jgi:hypothetical protein
MSSSKAAKRLIRDVTEQKLLEHCGYKRPERDVVREGVGHFSPRCFIHRDKERENEVWLSLPLLHPRSLEAGFQRGLLELELQKYDL